MPKRKSSRRDRLDHKRKWRKMIIFSDSESEKSDSEHEQIITTPAATTDPAATTNPAAIIDPAGPASTINPINPTPLHPEDTMDPVDPVDPVDPATIPELMAQAGLETSVEEPPIPVIDSELLAALGDPVEDIPDYGEDILPDLAQRWLPVLRKGLTKEAKENLLKTAKIPANCRLLRAPLLNAEICAACSDATRIRDKKLEISQNQLGLGITAVGRGLSLLLTGDDKLNKIKGIKEISDGCKILTELHHAETKARVKLITPGLDKAFLNVIQDVERDETLFGAKLSEKIKASRAIEKQSLQIKKPAPVPAQKPGTLPQRPTTRSQNQPGNWTGPSRFRSSSRGGRMGTHQSTSMPTRRSQSQPSSSTSKTAAASTSTKQRAPR